jgi:SAM-dependent methyltransferase
MADKEPYDSYSRFKGWDNAPSEFRPEDFACLLKAAVGSRGPLAILDYGFGDGNFMDWAKAAGHEVVGVDILPDMVEAARSRGHAALLTTEMFGRLGEREFDVVVALDVIEHMDAKDFGVLMELCRKVLKDDGIVLAKFPNGDSPFFGRYQFGDFTHGKPISSSSVRQLALHNGMKLVRAFNPRSLPPGLLRMMKRRLTYLARDMIEIFIGYVYFGMRIPMDPNIAVILKRDEDLAGHS